MAAAEPAGFRSNQAAPGDVSMTVRGRGPRLGTGSRDTSAPPYMPPKRRVGGERSDGASVVTPVQEVDPRDALIAELQQKVTDLEEQLRAKGADEDDEQADASSQEEDAGNEDEGDVDKPPEEAADPDSSEAHLQDEKDKYAEEMAAMNLGDLAAHLEARGQDLSECMTCSEEEAAGRCTDLLSEWTVKQLCDLASKRKIAIVSCLSVDRDQLMKLLGEELGQDPDGLEHMSDQELCDGLLDPLLDVDPAKFCDKAKLIAKLTEGIGAKALRGLLVDELGVNLSELLDKDTMIELAIELGPPEEAEVSDEEGTDEATKPKPKPGDPDWQPSQKSAPVGSAVNALRQLRRRMRPDWAPGRRVDGSWTPPDGTEYWKWRQSAEGKRWTLRSRQEHFDKYASAQLRPKCDASKAVSTMTRSQMNARLTLATKLEVTDRFRRNPLLKPKKNTKAGWLYKWRDDAQMWRKRWCQVEKIASADPAIVDPEYVLTYRAGKGKRELGSLRLLNGQLYHYGVVAQKKEKNESDDEEIPEIELEQEINTDSATDIELEQTGSDSATDTGLEQAGETTAPAVVVDRVRNRMRRNCSSVEEQTRRELLTLETLLQSLQLESELLHKINACVDQRFSGGMVQLVERLFSWHAANCQKSASADDISMPELSHAFVAAGLKNSATGAAVVTQSDLRKLFRALEADSAGRADMQDIRSFLLGQHHSLDPSKAATFVYDKISACVDRNFSGGVDELIERLFSWQAENSPSIDDISMPELSHAFLVAGLKDSATGAAVLTRSSLEKLFRALEADSRGRADMNDVRSFLLGEHHSLYVDSVKNTPGPASAQAALDPQSRTKRTSRVRRLIAKYHKERLRQEMQLNTILATKEGASICIVVVEESGRSGLFRTDLPGTQGRVDIHSWYLALKLLLAPQGAEVHESNAESLSMGSYKYMVPDSTKVGRSSRGAFAYEAGGQQEEEPQSPSPAELAVQQSEGNAVVLSGHPNAICNGEYHPVEELYEGWPRYESLAGTPAGPSMHLFRSIHLKKWVLSRRFVPDSEINNSNIPAEAGPVPVGTQTWRCFIKGEWVNQKLTVQVENRAVLQARVTLKNAEEVGDAEGIEAARKELDRLVDDDGNSDDEGSVATTGLITTANAPGIRNPQSVFAVRARTRSLVLPDQSKFEPWRNGMRRKRVDQRKELLISSTAKEWIPNGFKKASRCSQEVKVESITSGFLYPAENEKPDMP